MADIAKELRLDQLLIVWDEEDYWRRIASSKALRDEGWQELLRQIGSDRLKGNG